MRFLEERAETLIIIDDSNAVRALAKNPYTEVKYKMFAGKKIRYVATEGSRVARIEEDEGGTAFLCELEGREVRIDDMISMARAIAEHATSGNFVPLVRFLNWYLFLQELGLSVSSNSNSLDLTREGVLHVPNSVSAEVLESATYNDGSKVAKLLFTLKDKNDWVYRMFRNHECAIALVGIDETGQFWMHYLPPVYRDRAIIDCEIWLAGGVAGDNLIF